MRDGVWEGRKRQSRDNRAAATHIQSKFRQKADRAAFEAKRDAETVVVQQEDGSMTMIEG